MAKANAAAGAKDQVQVEYHHGRYPSQVATRYEVLRAVGSKTSVNFFLVTDDAKRHRGTIVVVSERPVRTDPASLKKLNDAIQAQVSRGKGIFEKLNKATVSLRASSAKAAPPASATPAKKTAKKKAKKKAASTTTAVKAKSGKKKSSKKKKARKAGATTSGPATTSGASTSRTTTSKASTTSGPKAKPTTTSGPKAKPAKKAGKKKAGKKKKARADKARADKPKARTEKARTGKKSRTERVKAREDRPARKGKKKGRKANSERNSSKSAGRTELPPPGMPSDEEFWANDGAYANEARSVGLATGTYPQNMLPVTPASDPQYAPVVGGPASTQIEAEWNRFLQEVQVAEQKQLRNKKGTTAGTTAGTLATIPQDAGVGTVAGAPVEPYEDLMGVFYPTR